MPPASCDDRQAQTVVLAVDSGKADPVCFMLSSNLIVDAAGASVAWVVKAALPDGPVGTLPPAIRVLFWSIW